MTSIMITLFCAIVRLVMPPDRVILPVSTSTPFAAMIDVPSIMTARQAAIEAISLRLSARLRTGLAGSLISSSIYLSFTDPICRSSSSLFKAEFLLS